MSVHFRVIRVEHVGIRVSDPEESVRFYQLLGFKEVVHLPDHQACELTNTDGITVNLIFNGVAHNPKIYNPLQDAQPKRPGITHIAFVIDSMLQFLEFCTSNNIAITEGPIRIGERRVACFIRDPDGVVLEFNALNTQ